jgi:hypothetical protein
MEQKEIIDCLAFVLAIFIVALFVVILVNLFV